MKPDTLNGEALYNVVNFCNCVALDLLPTLTKVKINYYFTEGHLAELFADNEVILTNCVLYGKDQPMQGPPPQEILVPERK
ncbi:MAG: hypothetical protein KJ941_04735 [Bacteroidetes bacterium]|nr:hypothetical protein [Bacteroidota bacterium]